MFWLGTEDRCEPQPIPKVVVGHEKDWLSVAPYALHYWEKLLLEPYSYSRDVAYVVVAPDNDYVLSSVRNFFRELSSTYEVFTKSHTNKLCEPSTRTWYDFMVVCVAFVVLFYGFELLRCLYTNKESNIALVC